MTRRTTEEARRWIPAIAFGGLVLLLQNGLGSIFAQLYPDRFPGDSMRMLAWPLFFAVGFVAAYRPRRPGLAGSIGWCAVRGFLWAALLSGVFYQFEFLTQIYSLARGLQLPPREPVIVAFGVLWVVAFSVLARSAMRLRTRSPKAAPLLD